MCVKRVLVSWKSCSLGKMMGIVWNCIFIFANLVVFVVA